MASWIDGGDVASGGGGVASWSDGGGGVVSSADLSPAVVALSLSGCVGGSVGGASVKGTGEKI